MNILTFYALYNNYYTLIIAIISYKLSLALNLLFISFYYNELVIITTYYYYLASN
jgi:hypothetical protein